MGFELLSFYVAILWGLIVVLKWGAKHLNVWMCERSLGKKKHALPPGDLGWPFIGNMWSFHGAFKSGNPNAFASSFVERFGPTGVYKCFMFGCPSILVTLPETCRSVLSDDDAFKPGWPAATMELVGRRSFIAISPEEHKRIRKLTAAPINGHEALSVYMEYIEASVVSSLEKWTEMGRIEFLTELRKLTFRIIMHIFLSSESEQVMEILEKEYTTFNYGVRALAIDIPGFAYHKALKARKRLAAIVQALAVERRKKRDETQGMPKMDMLDALLDMQDENGEKATDEDIIDLLLMYLNAGHESSGHMMMWATIFLRENPEILQKAKEEQEAIVKNMPHTQKGLTLKEVRQMDYLSKVIDEALRLVTFSLVTFREAKTDVNLKGYLIPKGWKVLVWFRSVHHNPDVYPQPEKFDPSRWDDHVPKPGTFLPFGIGSRLCPGNDLAKLEISIFLHHFLLNYEFERENPRCPVQYLPHPRPTDNCLGILRRVSQ